MPYSRKPIEVNTTRTFNDWRIEINAAIAKLNELFNSDNEFNPRPGALLDAVTISGSIIDYDTTFRNSNIHSSDINISTIRNSEIYNGIIDGATIRYTILESTTTVRGDVNNATITNPTISGGSWQGGAFSGASLNEVSLQGFDDNETVVVSIISHITGSSTVQIDNVPKDLSNGKFWFDNKEYRIISSDSGASTMEVENVEVDRTFSGDLTIKFGIRSLLRSPHITEPLFSGAVHMDGENIHMIIKSGDSARRISIAEGTPFELFFDTDLRTINLFNGTDVGGEVVFALPYMTSGDTLPAEPYFGQDYFLTTSGVWFKYSGETHGWQQLT